MQDLLKQVEEKIAYCRYWQSALVELEEMAEKLRRMIAAQPMRPACRALPLPYPPPSPNITEPGARILRAFCNRDIVRGGGSSRDFGRCEC